MATVNSTDMTVGPFIYQSLGSAGQSANLQPGGVYGGLQQAAMQQPSVISQWTTATAPYVDVVSKEDLEEALKTRAHINVAKDQEARICELEQVVGELVAYNKSLVAEKLRLEKEKLQEGNKLREHEELLKHEIEWQRLV